MRLARLTALVILALTLLVMPLVTQAQPSGRVPRIGYLGVPPRGLISEGFEEGLKERGYEDGKNILIEWRDAALGDLARLLRTLAAELVASDSKVLSGD
jgi:ABC-type uncharacterized transport system substrate-binding protein